jgi:hypothetical protein
MYYFFQRPYLLRCSEKLLLLHRRATITFLYANAETNVYVKPCFLPLLELALTAPTRQLAQS